MSIVKTIRTIIRRLLITTIILTMLFHEPTFNITLTILIKLHVLSRIIFDNVYRHIGAHYPACAAWFITTFRPAYTALMEYCSDVTQALRPFCRLAVARGVEVAAWWVRESPKYLCMLNGWLVGVGEWMTGLAETDVGMSGVMLEAKEQIGMFCALVRE